MMGFLLGTVLCLLIPFLAGGQVLIAVRTANDHSPFYIADKLRLYEKEGIEARVLLIPSNTEIVEGLKRRQFQMGAFPITTAIAAIAHRVPIKIVAMTGRGSDGILVRKDSGMRGLKDLVGKRIATIRASILDVLLLYALEEQGIDPKRDLRIFYFMKLGDMISALKTGQLDATSNTEPFMTEAELSGWGKILCYYTAFWKAHPCCVVVAHKEFIERSPHTLQKILKVHVEAVRYANDHPEETARIICEYMKGFDPDVVLESLDPQKMSISYEVYPDEVMRMAQLMKRYGLIEEVPPQGELLELGFLKEVTR